MNILFANLFWNYGADDSLEKMRHLHYPMGLAIIAGEIKRKRKDNLFALDSYIENISDEEIFNFIDKNRIDYIFLSMYLGNYQYSYLKKFINNIIRIFPRVRIIVGGPLASTVPEILLSNISPADERVICVVGEGEETIIELLDCIDNGSDLTRVRGICYRREAVRCNAERERIKSLDGYSRPLYNLFNTGKYVDYVKNANRCWEISASRGCYGSCVYCKLVFGRKITMRSADSIVREMEDFYRDYGINRFNFVDDNFLNSEKQVWDFYKALKNSDIKFKWRFQGRADCLSADLARSLVEVGLYDVSFGIESGAAEVLSQMNKRMDLDQARVNIRSLPPELDTHASFMVGMPADSQKTIDQTIEFIKDVGIKYTSAGIVTVFPGTSLYEAAKVKGLICDDDEYCNNLGPVYVKPYINFTRYPDHLLIEWAESINQAGLLS